MNNTTEKTEEIVQPNSKRLMTATVASTAVAVILGIGANILIGKISTRVHDQITTPKTDTNE